MGASDARQELWRESAVYKQLELSLQAQATFIWSCSLSDGRACRVFSGVPGLITGDTSFIGSPVAEHLLSYEMTDHRQPLYYTRRRWWSRTT